MCLITSISLHIVTLTAHLSTINPVASLPQGLVSNVNVVWAYLRVDAQNWGLLKYADHSGGFSRLVWRGVVYFDQRLGAAHAKHFLKYAFSMFFKQKSAFSLFLLWWKKVLKHPKKTILTFKWCAKHPFAGWNTQQMGHLLTTKNSAWLKGSTYRC